jgi:hypothetical protein
VRMSVNSGPVADYMGLHSKDYAQVFLTNKDFSMNIPSGATVEIFFDYLTYNGAVYGAVTTESIILQLP